MSEYKRRYTNTEKRQKLAKFNSVYYEGDPNNWKISRLPNWMNFYGYELDKELHGKSPKYYRKFKQGTIVMIDYGVPVGTELGGRHFGIVISNNDTKYKSKILVVPLSSHYHRGYIDLGYGLMNGIIELGNNRVKELKRKIKILDKRLKTFRKNNSGDSFSFSAEEMEFFKNQHIDISSLLKSNRSIDITKRHPDLENLLLEIKKTNSWEKYPTIFKLVSFLETIILFQKEIIKQLKTCTDIVDQLIYVTEQLRKYNKQSFGVISDIKSVSKLKVAKLNHFTISGNAYVSEDVLQNIKLALIKTIE
uniref:PemK-like protein n=1 Tax=Siphoviridae sp. cttqT1 TaxID=2827961 RepID=A0A8S5TNY2_9CAUD|nr:MAG TPA: PemK-like protein [Caudoviricetes sp.]DAF64841.1 MAG TPA: PemK-like protein [Siphoviridae sp. cttqT1]